MARLETLRAKVGATILDVMRPGWADEIKVADLDLGSCSACVLGQLFGSYNTGAERLFALQAQPNVPSYLNPAIDDAACASGFLATDRTGRPLMRYNNLTAAWKREIAKRVTA